MMKRAVLVFTMLSLAALANAKSYSVTLFQTTTIGSEELKPGEYKVEVNDTKAVIRNGKKSVEAVVKVETAEQKFNSTSVRYRNGDGKYHIQEIRLGGTNTKIVFN
ncbi:MAG: hypothetical protein ACRD96_29460 [Bryobacteraceae bacterium]